MTFLWGYLFVEEFLILVMSILNYGTNLVRERQASR